VVLLVLGSVALLPARGWAQTLDECLALARAHAPALRAADAGFSLAEQAIREARAALAPTLRLSTSFVQSYEGQQTVFQVPGAPAPQLIKFGSASALDARLVADYTLYSGGANAARVQAAQAARTGQAHGRQQADADLVLRVSQAFYRAIAAQRLETAALDAMASARAHRTTSVARVRAGVAPRLDSLRSNVDLSQRGTAVVRAREAVRLARVELETSIGAPLDSSRALVEPTGPLPEVPEAQAALARALHDRLELAAYDDALRENQHRFAAARAARGPAVSLSATAQYLGPNRDEDYWNPDDPGLRTHRLFAGIGLSVPIFDAGLADARAGQVAAERAALEARRKEAELSIRREVERAISDLTVALAAWQSDSGRVATAREALRTAEAGYKGGTSTSTDVRDAESALADARAEEAQSLMDTWTAQAALDHATGALARKEH
jgi:outer membrane protein TolC